MLPQGLLEGVKGALGELEPWVAEDVDTIATAAAGMSVILNDVLDLGQVRCRLTIPDLSPGHSQG